MSVKKIKSQKDLEILADRFCENDKNYKARVLICMTGCRALGAQEVAAEFRQRLIDLKLEDKFKVVDTGCIGMCALAPAMLIEPYDYLYGGVKPEDVDDIISLTLEQGKPVERLCVKKEGEPQPSISRVDFYTKQKKLVLENCGRIDPTNIEHYIERDGYKAAAKVLTQIEPEQVIEAVTSSGLRGRGGAGFPTGVKWNFCRKAPGDQKYVICNADEGDPGAFMDRALLEGDPHRVIEGMIVAAYAIGACEGFIYVRAEYPIAVEHINIALDQARQFGLLGEDIMGSGFNFDIKIRMGAGAFVCGEETALIASLEGKRGMPRPRPPFPAVSGLMEKPTNINNVETFANIPGIINNGHDHYSEIGTENSKGTKIFALAGKVVNTGLVEVPMGTTLRQIVYDIGGGLGEGKEFKAAQLGGPSGGCIPAKYLDVEIDYDSVQEIGAIMGSGGLIVMDQDVCMVDVAKYFLDFTQSESCGKCTPCRVGTKRMLDILEEIADGTGTMEHLSELEELAERISVASLCGLGQTAPNPVLSTIKNFRQEYQQHIIDKKCCAGICNALLNYWITGDCVGCGACKKVCPADAIEGENKKRHVIDPVKCIKCGMCYDICKFNSVTR